VSFFPALRLRTLRASVAKHGIFLYFETMIKHTKIILPLLIAALLVCGCDRPSGGLVKSPKMGAYDEADYYRSSSSAGYSQQMAEMAAYDMVDSKVIASETRWEGTGYNGPEITETRLAGRGFSSASAEDQAAGNGGDGYGAPLTNTSWRKLVKRASITVRVDDIDTTDAAINDLMEQYGAYASSTSSRENHRFYTIRVPSSAYDAFLADMDGMGRVLHRSENTEDVSLRYYDLEGRLASKEELLATYRSYLARARNMEEILAVEARISDLHNEIDGTGKELRQLANLIDYSTVVLDIGGPATSEPYRGPTLIDRVGELFMGFGEFLSGAVVVLIGLVIYGIPVLAVAVVLFWLLFGKVGLLKKLFRIAAGKKQGKESAA
jgi:hypothetical protein